MAAEAVHCPFLNRSDERCGSHFSLDHLSDAFDQCVGAYASCRIYAELLAERQNRRAEAAVLNWTRGTTSVSEPARLVPLTLTASARREATHF